jgi:hypothetical protein
VCSSDLPVIVFLLELRLGRARLSVAFEQRASNIAA